MLEVSHFFLAAPRPRRRAARGVAGAARTATSAHHRHRSIVKGKVAFLHADRGSSSKTAAAAARCFVGQRQERQERPKTTTIETFSQAKREGGAHEAKGCCSAGILSLHIAAAAIKCTRVCEGRRRGYAVGNSSSSAAAAVTRRALFLWRGGALPLSKGGPCSVLSARHRRRQSLLLKEGGLMSRRGRLCQ